MAKRRDDGGQFDLLIPYISDLPLRDQRETMERPFFSLAKRKRLKPIEYASPDGSVYVNISPNPQYGMATIWDADILIWAASTLNAMRAAGINDLPRKLSFQPYDVLKTIRRDTGGYQYEQLRHALARLQSTTIRTNIRPRGRRRERQFNWVEEWTDTVDESSGRCLGMTLTLSSWIYEGILMDGGLLAIDPAYFGITGGRERWLYRVARKHAGAAGPEGFAISLPTLFEKSGAEGTYRRFKFEMQAIVKRNYLPGYDLQLEFGSSEPFLRMTRRSGVEIYQADLPNPQATTPPQPASALSEAVIERIRHDFPGWDIYALQSEFDGWIADNPRRAPRDYSKAFYGFVRRRHSQDYA
jgi:plasmid replication initiation protein